MKVLMTGCTLQQVGRAERVRLQYCSNPSLLARAIQVAGHELDWRPVVPGEDLSRYDCLIVGLANLLSFGSRFSLGAIWAAGHSNTAYLLDDWNVGAVDGSIKGTARSRVDQALMRPVLPRDNKEQAWEVIQEMYGILDELASGSWKRPTLGSFFMWGDFNKFKVNTNVGKIWAFDPSCYQPKFNLGVPEPGTFEFMKNKKRRWVLATLPNHDKWVEKKIKWRSKWELLTVGHLKSGKPRYTEAEVVRIYADSWGVLSPPYKHAGSGWWRARYKYAMDAFSILLAEPQEVQPLGGVFTYPYNRLEELEQLTDSELMECVKDQIHSFYEWSWDEDQFVQWVDGMIKCLAGETDLAHPPQSAELFTER